MKVLILDNYDSFTYNLYQVVGEILHHAQKSFVVDVIRNNQISIEQIQQAKYDRIIISPGPGSPQTEKYFGVCKDVLLKISPFTPTLGVCLGMQGLAFAYGGKVVPARVPMHGKTSRIKHSGKELFAGLPQNIEVMRYHSLVVADLPACLKITAQTGRGPAAEIMAITHRDFPIFGVQFHPESFSTEAGTRILQNFLLNDVTKEFKPSAKALMLKLEAGQNLFYQEAFNLQHMILNGQIDTPALVKIFTNLDKRRLTEEELRGFFQASLAAMSVLPYKEAVLDTCGTGGDKSGSFNISTAAAIVCAAAGAAVAKHGNRAASSQCGSADVLEALGVNINLTPRQAAKALKQSGFVFLFARNYHPSFKHAGEARKLFGKRTYFNLLGPLLNPAKAEFRVHGLADFSYAPILGKLLLESGVKKAWLIHAEDGLDEISPFAPTDVLEFTPGREPKKFKLDPKHFGLAGKEPSAILGGDASANAKIISSVLQGQGNTSQRAAVILNAAAGLTVLGKAENFEHGIKAANWAIDSGKAYNKLQEIITMSNRVK